MLIWHLFKSPSAFIDDPWGFARNQTGHALIVGFLPVFLLGAWAALPAICLYAIWEAAQWRLYGAAPSDGLEDLAYVTGGVLAALWWPVLIVLAVMLASGVQYRREMRG
ncbi:hypothetical protein BYZ73_20810 [Rhodovulum viride]|uniref:Uncharacterized protein n=1 Tax=Rhodovulum viride TaxID=1231134 RepID=A0ABX9DCR0_9RHOB|nr:hypothetical protein [Rhodovulum viride]RAP39386.1 hypothetical protein BYZ73_20810 [Rhodovulum viride]